MSAFVRTYSCDHNTQVASQEMETLYKKGIQEYLKILSKTMLGFAVWETVLENEF